MPASISLLVRVPCLSCNLHAKIAIVREKGAGRYMTGFRAFRADFLLPPRRASLLSLLIPRMGFSICVQVTSGSERARNPRKRLAIYVMKFPRVYGKPGKREGKKRVKGRKAFDRTRTRERTAVNLKTFDDTRLYFRECCEHIANTFRYFVSSRPL